MSNNQAAVFVIVNGYRGHDEILEKWLLAVGNEQWQTVSRLKKGLDEPQFKIPSNVRPKDNFGSDHDPTKKEEGKKNPDSALDLVRNEQDSCFWQQLASEPYLL